MKIVWYQEFGKAELLARLRSVKLCGYGHPLVYEGADIQVITAEPLSLTPAQRYILIPTRDAILRLADAFESEGVDIFALQGGVWFFTDEMESETPLPLIPPVVEVSAPDGEINLINDGIHRVAAAIKRQRLINVVKVTGVPSEYPYYAHPLPGGWEDTEEVYPDQLLVPGFRKKNYRDIDNYKALFRDFNAVFPGVQEKRPSIQTVSVAA